MKSFKELRQLTSEQAELDEAIKLNSKVKIHAPGKDYHDKVGHVGEIRKGLHDKAPKTYTVDYDYDTKTGNKKSIQLDKSQLKMHKEDAELDEAIKKPNATTRHLRQYPVSDKDVAKPITYYSLVHKATNKVLSTHKDLESAKDEHRGMDQGERAHYRIATTTKAPKSFSMKEDAEGVAEAAFKDPSPMMKDSIKQDRIRSLKNLIAVAKVKGVHHKVKEYELELKKLKETTEVTEAGAFSYGAKPPRKGSVAYNALMKRKEQDKNRVKEIEAIGTKNHHVGVAKVTKAVAEGYTGRETKDGTWRVFKDGQAVAVAGPFKSRDEAHAWIKNRHVGVAKVTKEEIEDVTEAKDTEMYKYIDQSGGHQIKGKSGTYVGYTHSATKGKGANILKHNTTKKYYAAGGSSTAFTAKTTLHDTPEAAAKAYHKGNLAEASPMIKPPANEFAKKEDAFAHAKQHGGKVMKKTFTHPTSGMQNVSYVVRKESFVMESEDEEGGMAKGELMQMAKQAQALASMMDDEKQLDSWVQSKITKAADYLDSVHDFLMNNDQEVDETEDEDEEVKEGFEFTDADLALLEADVFAALQRQRKDLFDKGMYKAADDTHKLLKRYYAARLAKAKQPAKPKTA